MSTEILGNEYLSPLRRFGIRIISIHSNISIGQCFLKHQNIQLEFSEARFPQPEDRNKQIHYAVFGSIELRYQAMHKVFMGFPMDLEIAPFLDFGQVFNGSDFAGESNINPGMSMRMLNRPNIGIVANGAIGQDGLVFTGGVSLPF